MDKQKIITNNLPLLLLSIFAFTALAEDKHHEDPTRIITKAGIGYSNGFQIKGSIGLDESRMLNGRITDNGDWRVGGSWLTDIGIFNFNFDNDEHRRNYSVGTFVPLSVFDVDTGNWQIFPMAGASYTDFKDNTERDNGYGGYAGAFAIRPINDQWSFIGAANKTFGSNHGYWGGAGLSYKINARHSTNLFGITSVDQSRTDNRISWSYTITF